MEGLRSVLSLSRQEASADGAPTPLPALFSRCHSVHLNQDQVLASRDPELISAAVELLHRADTAVHAAGIFSSNEDQEDLATADVKYLLIPFYRGSLLASAPVVTSSSAQPGGSSAGSGSSGGAGPGPSSVRLAAAQRGMQALDLFLTRCEQYDVLGELGKAAVRAAAAGGGPAAMDPATKRNFKVEKFKREKALNGLIGALQARRDAAAARAGEDDASAGPSGSVTSGTAGAGAASAAPCGSPPSWCGHMDEEDERRLWLSRLELAALQAMDLQAALRQELELLQHAVAREQAAAAQGPGGREQQRQAGQEADGAPDEAAKAELMQRLRAICRDLDGAKREQIKRDVFKPSHILPTMTVEEAGEIERQQAMEREEKQRMQEDKERARRAALDSDEEDAEDKAKQRAWDDWADANPRGAGNSKLRPCA